MDNDIETSHTIDKDIIISTNIPENYELAMVFQTTTKNDVEEKLQLSRVLDAFTAILLLQTIFFVPTWRER